jgi:hypothetical protein
VGGRGARHPGRGAPGRPGRSTARAGKAELTRQAHDAERQKGTCGGNDSALANRARETERERERMGEENWHRQVGPTRQRAREGGRARGRTAADRQGPPVRRRGRAAWLGLVGRLGCFLLFFFLWIF